MGRADAGFDELGVWPRHQRAVVLGDGKRVTLGGYIAAVKRAKANPDREFDRGLTCWWPCTGRQIVRQFRDGLHDRINQRGRS
jgi:hypothetical protein